MVGRTLQRYRIVEQVGHGGMAVVYRGVDEALERDVAVKLLHPHLAERVEHRRRLAREAKAVARLHHPNILEIYDFSGEDSAEAYLVTELIKGRTLRAFAQAHPFDPPELAAACVHELAGALAHAHAHGIVHRDLKPDNVMIREDGPAPVVKLMDFGIAQIVDRDERMTMTGSLMGSPAHMAPEIIDGEEADERSDIFSLGTILYWLVAGQLPFEAPSPGALLKRILAGEYTDPRVLRPSVSDALAKVIHDALARDRSQRVQNALELQARLGKALAEVGLERPGELLARFLKTPDEAARQTRTDVVARLLETGDAAAKARKTARALGAYSRVIAIVPGTPEAGAARQAIDRLKSRAAWRKRIGVVLGAGAMAGVVLGWSAFGPSLPSSTSAPAPQPEPQTPAPTPEVRWDPPAPVTPAPMAAPSVVATKPPVRPRPAPVTVASPRPVAAPQVTAAALAPVAVFVTSSPAAATVFIDDKPRGFTPTELTELPGKHRVRLEHEGCAPFGAELQLEPGAARREIREKLQLLPAELTLAVEGPEDAGILIDDQWRGLVKETRGKPLLIHIQPDPDGRLKYYQTVVVRLTRDGFQEQRLELRVDAGKHLTVPVKMVPQG